MKSIISLIVIVSLICVPMTGTASGQENNILEELARIEKTYGNIGEYRILEEDEDIEYLYQFDSIYEFEIFISELSKKYGKDAELVKELITNEHITENNISVINTPTNSAKARTINTRNPTYNDVYTFNWWAPFTPYSTILFGLFGTLLCWRNISVSMTSVYIDNLWRWQSINSCFSYITGVSGVSWHQTAWAANIYTTYYTDDTFSVTVHGYYLFGIVIGGIPVGITQNDSWTQALRYM